MGLLASLGGFGRAIWNTIKSVAEPITTAFGLGRLAGVELSPVDLTREYRKVINLVGLSAQIAELEPDQYIPPELYQEAEIPWKRPYAYEVTISGRDLKTGQFTRTQRAMPFSRQLTIGEIEDQALAWFAAGGEYPQVDITHISVTSAEYRAGEQDRLW